MHKSPLECGFVYANNREGQEFQNTINCMEKGLTGGEGPNWCCML